MIVDKQKMALDEMQDKIDIIAIPEPRKSLLLGNTAKETSENVY